MKSSIDINNICYYSLSDEDALSVLRVLGPVKELGITVTKGMENGQAYVDRVTNVDVVVIQRDFPRFLDSYDQILSLAKSKGVPVIYDLDDLLFELPDDHPDRYSNVFAESLLPILQTLTEADLVTVPSESLRNYVLNFNKNVVFLPNLLNDHLWQIKPPVQYSDQERIITIGYMGGHSHIPDLAILKPVISHLAQIYSSKIEFHFWGVPPTKELKSLPQTHWHKKEIWNYAKFVSFFQSQKADIFVAPLVDNEFNNCKSNIKYLEYGAQGVPGVFSRVGPYSKAVKHGENGFLASTVDEWINNLSQLIEDQVLRNTIAANAQADIRSNWLLSQKAPLWLAAYRKAYGKKKNKEYTRPVYHQLYRNLSHQIFSWGSNKDIQIGNLQGKVGNLQKQIEDIQNQLENLQKQREDLQNTISERDGVIERQRTQIAEFVQTNQKLNFELTEIYKSRAWKVALFLRSVRVALFPPGNNLITNNPLLKRLYELMLKSARKLVEEGLIALIRKVYSFLVSKVKRSAPESRNPNKQSLIARNVPLYKNIYDGYLETAIGVRESTFVSYSETFFDSTDIPVKLIAFYLPQFHPIPENDEWWGKGFTEWTNVSKAVPQFAGHYQPHLPGELGFYDLRIPEVLERQVNLARNYGIYGFCFHYYWFNGRRLLEKPLDLFLNNPKIDFPFCLCWANENWTRRWDGLEDDILLAQEHSIESDLAFITDIAPMFKHKNYIKVNGHPLLIIYRVQLLPDPEATGKRWKDYCKENGIPEPYLVAAQTFGFNDPSEVGFDAAVEFPPHNIGIGDISYEFRFLNPDFAGRVYRYGELAKTMVDMTSNNWFKLFMTVCPAWDNEPRKPGRGHVFVYSSPNRYQAWLEEACKYALQDPDPDKGLVFINAWNEWGEGAYLEPDRKYGYAYLQATLDALVEISNRPLKVPVSLRKILFVSHDAGIRGGAQALLLKIIRWLKKHTSIQLKILFLDGGGLLSSFQELADTAIFSDIVENTQGEEEVIDKLMEFCEGRPDLVYANSVASGQKLVLLKQLKSPILMHIHELEMSIERYAKNWIDDIQKYPDHFIACSNAVRDNLVDNYKINPEAVSTVYGGILAESNYKVLSTQERKKARKSLGLDQNKLIVLGCGLGMAFRKGADLFIEVAKLLKERFGDTLRFYWIGDFDPYETDPKYGSWMNHLKTLRANGLENFVTFLGFKENPENFLQVGDIFVLPSREDPFPLVVLEAAKFEMPIITFDKSGGSPEFVEEDAGYVVPFEDTSAMADAIISLIEDVDLRQSFGRRAREKLLNRFTVDKISPFILSTCRRVADKKPVVSVIVPNYNHAKYLPERLESIFNQSFLDFEVIILDDASTDSSLEVIEKYANKADVQIIMNPTNSGSPFRQWIKGLDIARADFIWIAESDDLCEPNFLETLIPMMSDPEIKLAYVDSNIINENGEITGDYLTSEYLLSLSQSKWRNSYQVSATQEINEGLGVKNTILNISAVLFRKFELNQELKKALENMHIAGDWYFIVNALHGGKIHFESKKLNYHRRHSESVIGKTISDKRIKDFFYEFYTVQDWIANNYIFDKDFLSKWEYYLRTQWKDFCPDKDFDDLQDYYPFDEMKMRISRSLSI